MFLLKKIMGPFLMPVSVVLVLALTGLFCLWFTRRQKTGKVLVTVAIGLLGLLSYDPISNLLTGALEKRYRPVTKMASVQGVKWIVVLGGGSGVDPELPLSSYLSGSSMFRLCEGVSIQKKLPGSKLIVTGGSGWGSQRSGIRKHLDDSDGWMIRTAEGERQVSGVGDRESEVQGRWQEDMPQTVTPVAEVMAEVAKEWGVKAEDIVVETASKDTEDHAVFVKEIVGDDRFILVTSASHMPRAMGLFEKQGMQPVPAPTDYMVKKREGGLQPGRFFPSAGALEKVERAVHEYLGLAWARLRGQME